MNVFYNSGIKLETNMTFERMIDSLKNKNSNMKEFKVDITSQMKRKDNDSNILENLENDMNKIVGK